MGSEGEIDACKHVWFTTSCDIVSSNARFRFSFPSTDPPGGTHGISPRRQLGNLDNEKTEYAEYIFQATWMIMRSSDVLRFLGVKGSKVNSQWDCSEPLQNTSGRVFI